MTTLTPEQTAAVYTRGADILVCAAAGSGKTAVLTQRIVSAATRAAAPIDIDRMLVCTFSEAAAQEMRSRIARSLSEAARENPQNLNIRKQLSLLPLAPITTIHAFCRRLVADYAHTLGLDPAFKVADEAETTVIKQEVIEQLLENEYAREDNAAFAALAETFSARYLDFLLRELILKLHGFICASPWPVARVKDYCAVYDETAQFSDMPWASLFTDFLECELNAAIAALENAAALCALPGGPLPYQSGMLSDLADLQGLLELVQTDLASNWDEIARFSYTQKSLSPIKKTDPCDPALKEAAAKLRKDAKKWVSDIIERYFENSPLSLHQGRIAAQAPLIREAASLTLKFNALYSTAKKERNILDFNDLEQYALALLYEKGSTVHNHTPSEIAAEVRGRYDEVLTDEYQDTNLIQELILQAVANPSGRFMVGDVKQSIYRFRQARPELFIPKQQTYAPHSDTPWAPQLRIDLNANFRSRKNITDTINYLFCQLMSSKACEIEYDETARLYPKAEYPQDGENIINDTTEIYLIETALDEDEDEDGGFDEDESGGERNPPPIADAQEQEFEQLSRAEAEATFIARRIKTMVDGTLPQRVFDKQTGEYRLCKYSDICVLAFSVKGISEAFTKVFERYKIPIYMKQEGGFFGTSEVMTILSLLNVIDNPKQDIHLITALYSPLYALTPDELVLLRQTRQKGSFYDCVLAYVNEAEADTELVAKTARFLSDYDHFTECAAFMPISELLWEIYYKTNYYDIAGAMPHGAARRANLRVLCETAVAFEETRLKGMRQYLRYIERVRAAKKAGGADLPEAAKTHESANAVRLMTIHGSKGLEFPVVFLAAAHRRFRKSSSESVITDPDFGFAMDYLCLEHRIKYNTLPKAALAFRADSQRLSELIRVLYVALTRAKEKLIITGCVKSFDAAKIKWENVAQAALAQLPKHYILKSVSFLDWIMPQVLRYEKGAAALAYGNCKISFTAGLVDTRPPAAEDAFAGGELFAALEPPAASETRLFTALEREELCAHLEWQYPHSAAAVIPAKISVSEIKRLYQQEILGHGAVMNYPSSQETAVFAPPNFDSEKPKPINIGTAIHTVMEHLILTKDYSERELSAFITALAEKRRITAEEAALIPKERILAFLHSDLCTRIKKSSRVCRETPFVLALTPEEAFLPYNTSGETLLTHGIVDLYFEENGRIILVDYKSDFVPGPDASPIVKRYTPQLTVYKKAIERIEQLAVAEVYLYLFGVNKAVACEI